MRIQYTRRWVNLVTFILLIITNILANYLKLNNQTTGEVADKFPTYFVPASFTFLIWGLIYLLLLSFTIYQFKRRNKRNPYIVAVGYWFSLSNILSSLWLVLWHYEVIVYAFFTMIALTITLVKIYYNIITCRYRAKLTDNILVKVPFTMYLSWISFATIANLDILLYSLDWNQWGLSKEAWFIVLLGLVTMLISFLLLFRKDMIFWLVFAWGFWGIRSRFHDVGLIRKSITVAFIVITLFWVLTFIKKRKDRNIFR
ncbi:hypothetical protein RH915_05490 [Serpentinicella sp. ANB-PHB4]|uniref:hypothetical protein n=1 Tax=Serpentinicella sp. ANB-PHB4 TaxID=3074076 RepID=UPI002859E7D6|nr:hypothetical protein [Serpentinicella sp. ANB-PHB4]MDR5658935.1 hypothetical protein [Serpentinicella sp. ANB-PHB4]